MKRETPYSATLAVGEKSATAVGGEGGGESAEEIKKRGRRRSEDGNSKRGYDEHEMP